MFFSFILQKKRDENDIVLFMFLWAGNIEMMFYQSYIENECALKKKCYVEFVRNFSGYLSIKTMQT